MARPLDLVAGWPVPHAAAAVMVGGAVVDTIGDVDREFRLASIAKPITAWACMIAVEEGIVDLSTVVGQPGCTLEHLLSHAGGYPFDGTTPIAAPERQRIYSNTGIEMAADLVAQRAGMPFEEYLRDGVLQPLGMTATTLRGSPAHGLWSTVTDVTTFLAEVVTPRLVSAAGAAAATSTHFPGLGGIVPGVGRFERSAWGLGFEIKGDKSPHWTGDANSAATFGHFGGAGTMTWTDPEAPGTVALVALTDRSFDDWADTALKVWPQLSDAVLMDHGAPRAGASAR